MKRRATATGAMMLALLFSGGAAHAQAQSQDAAAADAAPVDEGLHPADVAIGKSDKGRLLTDKRGMTLYSLNMRIARARTGATLDYCIGPCADRWKPLAAPANAAPVGRWKPVEAVQGWQWTYRGNLVFTFAADKAPGALGGDGYDDLWSAIHYVPTVPKVLAPAEAKLRFVDAAQAYQMTDGVGRALFTPRAKGGCATQCAAWTPLVAGMAARPVGDWSIIAGNDRAQWAYKGRPVFVSAEPEATDVPGEGVAIRL